MITYNDNGLKKTLNNIPEDLKREIHEQIINSLAEVEEYAKNNHRYKDRTKRLDNAYSTIFIDWNVGKLFLNWAKAPYAVLIHNGFGSWKRDQFLYKALSKLKNKIVKDFEKIINRIKL